MEGKEVSGKISLARAVLQGALLRQDAGAPQLSRDDIERFHSWLNETLRNGDTRGWKLSIKADGL